MKCPWHELHRSWNSTAMVLASSTRSAMVGICLALAASTSAHLCFSQFRVAGEAWISRAVDLDEVERHRFQQAWGSRPVPKRSRRSAGRTITMRANSTRTCTWWLEAMSRHLKQTNARPLLS